MNTAPLLECQTFTSPGSLPPLFTNPCRPHTEVGPGPMGTEAWQRSKGWELVGPLVQMTWQPLGKTRGLKVKFSSGLHVKSHM